ncbi:MAG: Anthranilate synthase component 1, partial [Actinomycetota bacterium]
MTTPDLENFRKLAKTRRVIPVFRKISVINETALGLYRKLADERAGTFLLESAEHGRSWSRYSFVGVASSAMLSERAGKSHWSGKVPQGICDSDDPIKVLRETLDLLFTPGVNE